MNLKNSRRIKMQLSTSVDGELYATIVSNKKPDILRFNGCVYLTTKSNFETLTVQLVLTVEDLADIYSFMTPALIAEIKKRGLD
jgi:hypothetical protein